jgi:hypothetical protein
VGYRRIRRESRPSATRSPPQQSGRASRTTASRLRPNRGAPYAFTVIEHPTRRIRILGATAHPTTECIVQLGRNLLMQMEDANSKARFLLPDRESKFTAAFDALPADVSAPLRAPRSRR